MIDNIIKNILREESEVKEMGIKINKLVSRQPGNYLVKSMKAKEKNKKESEKIQLKQMRFDSLVESLSEMYNNIRESIKNLDWRELKLYQYNRHYYVIFPRKIMSMCTAFNKLYDKIQDIYHYKSHFLKTFRFSNELESMYVAINGYMSDYSNLPKGVSGIELYLDSGTLNRTHFPGGLPYSFLGLNLGVKVYRKMLDDKGFIQSGSDASESAQNMWRQLIQSSDLSCAITKYGVIVFDKNLSKEEKIKYLAEFVLDKYGDERRRRSFDVDKDIFFDSALTSQIGRNNIQKMLDDIFQYTKDEGDSQKRPYEDGFIIDILNKE
jgi:hypothetical protein